MGMIKYAVYLGVIIVIALVFEQFITGVYNLTLQGVAGNLSSYIFLVVIYFILFILGRAFFDKKLNSKSSQFILWGSMVHIGAMLAVYLYSINPALLFIFPAVIVIGLWSRNKTPGASKFHFKFRATHPEFIDERGGVCVLRSGSLGFALMKFFRIYLPIPLKELLLYLYNEKIECCFEVQGNGSGITYYLAVLGQGRNYDQTFKEFMDRNNRLRQFLRKEAVHFEDISDVISAQHTFYLPFFPNTPFKVDTHGTPQEFPAISNANGEIILQQEFDEQVFSVFSMKPHFAPGTLYQFLGNLNENYFLQIHLHPLSDIDVTLRAEELNQRYRDSIKRLSAGLEDNAEFQAASYLFNQVGQSSKDSIEPLLDKEELDHLDYIKKEIENVKFGRKIGLWDVEFSFLGSIVLAQTLNVKFGGTNQRISPHAISALTARTSLGQSQILDSKILHRLLPNTYQE